MRTLIAAYLPAGFDGAGENVIFEDDALRVVAPRLDAHGIARVCDHLIAARDRLTRMPTARVVHAIDGAARLLRETGRPEREDVLLSLHHVSGFSRPMAELLLDRVARDWLAPALYDVIDQDLGGAAAIDTFIPRTDGRRVRAVAPPLGLHVFAGNVPGVGVTSIVRALLVRSAVLGKSAAAEPALAPAFAALLATVDPELADCLALTWWPGGDPDIEAAALDRADLVVHYGGADAIADLRARAPARVRFIEHGPRFSFAIVDAGGDTDRSAPAALARAVALFDQQGCVSPQVAWVIGTPEHARDFAARTADALARVQTELPRGRIHAAEAAAIRDARARAEFAAIDGRGGHLWTPDDLAWSVILSDHPALETSCLNRTLIIKHVPTFDALPPILSPFAHSLQTVGLAGFHGDRLEAAAIALAGIGATRITSIADMPWPPPAWHHDGRGPLQELIRWVDLEM